MKYLLPLFLAVFAPLPLAHAEDYIEFSTRFVEADASLKLPTDLAALNQMKGVDMLSAPRATAKPDQKVQIEVTHQIEPPGGGFVAPDDKPTSGVTFQGIAHFQDGGIAYRVHLTVCDIVAAAAKGARVETESHDVYATGTAKDGEMVPVHFASPRDGKQTVVFLTLTRQAPAGRLK